LSGILLINAGISKSSLAYIFDLFYQDNDSSSQERGTGVGLTYTKEIIDNLEGEITVESTLGEGTEFTIHLPIHHLANKNDLDFNSLNVTNDNSTENINFAEQSLPRLLLIEDNVDVITYLKKILEGKYDVHTANNGKSGVQVAIEQVPDIILSDVMMPNMDGYEVCKILKQDIHTSHIPILLLTAKVNQIDRLKGLEYGADAFITKPFDKLELLIQVKQLLEVRNKLHEFYGSTKLSDNNQSNLPKNKEDGFINQVRVLILQNLNDSQFNVSQLAQAMSMSQMQIYRKLKALTGKTPTAFIRLVRLEKGKELLSLTNKTISEMAYEVGFNAPSYFSKSFQKKFEIFPREFGNKFILNYLKILKKSFLSPIFYN